MRGDGERFYGEIYTEDLCSKKKMCKEGRDDVRVKKAATSMQQSTECMRGLQVSFPRMKDHLDYEEHGERQFVMKMYVLLFNLRFWLVGINQIRNVYLQWLDREVNEESMN